MVAKRIHRRRAPKRLTKATGIDNHFQATFEYLLVYGIVIVIIVGAISILVLSGAFSPAKNLQPATYTGFSPFLVSSQVCNSTGLYLALAENGYSGNHNTINLSSAYLAAGSGFNSTKLGLYGKYTDSILLFGRQSFLTFNSVSCNNPGSRYTAKLQINYSYISTNIISSELTTSGTVSGTAAAKTPLFYTEFTESGLPAGHTWSVYYNGVENTSSTPDIWFTETVKGSYQFTIPQVSNSSAQCETTYTPIPDSGSFQAGSSSPYLVTFSGSTSCVSAPPFMLALTSNKISNLSIINMTTNSIVKTITGPSLNDSCCVIESPNYTFAYVANIGNSVAVVNINLGKIVENITGFDGVRSESLTPNGTILYVTDYGDSEVSVVNLKLGKVVNNIPVPGMAPWDTQLWSQKNLLYVMGVSGQVSIINTTSQKVIENVSVPSLSTYGYIELDVNKDEFYVGLGDAGEIEVFNLTTNSFIKYIYLLVPAAQISSSNGDISYIASYTDPGEVAVINTTTNDIIANIPMPSPITVAISPNNQIVYAGLVINGEGDVELINTSTNSGIENLTIPAIKYSVTLCVSDGLEGCTG